MHPISNLLRYYLCSAPSALISRGGLREKDTMKLEKLFNSKVDRRRVLGNLGMMGAGAVLTACGTNTMGQDDNDKDEQMAAEVDAAILNFALNLEYLEAAFYLAAVGRLDEMSDIPGFENIVAGEANTFESDVVAAYADEIATDELNHVKFLRTALADAAVAIPAINVAGGPEGAFGAAAKAAGANAGLDAATQEALTNFDPYASDLFFLHGAFIFEDVGVTAYKGASPLVTNPDFLEAAAGILAVEAYHSGEIRTLLYAQRDETALPAGLITGSSELSVTQVVGAISALRATLGGGKDQSIVVDGRANIVLADPATSIAYSRTPAEVLAIVYGGGAVAEGGLFFPEGLNGDFSALLG